MSRTAFTEENQAAILASVGAGASLEDAARVAGVRHATVKGWITRGRREGGAYGEFVAAIEAARREAADQAPMDPDEFQRHLDAAVRAGSVSAMKLWDERNRRRTEGDQRPSPVGSKITSLAEARQRRESER